MSDLKNSINHNFNGFNLNDRIDSMRKNIAEQFNDCTCNIETQNRTAWIENHVCNGWNDWLDISCKYCHCTIEKANKLYEFCPECGREMY